MRRRRFAPLFLLLLAVCAGPAGRPASAADIPDQQPRPTVQVPPDYPLGLAMMDKSGIVLLTFVVDINGLVTDIRVLHTTDPGFNEAAVAAVAKWRFIPGKKNGRPVNVRMELPFQFNISSRAEASNPSVPPGAISEAQADSSLDQQPQIILRVEPAYPQALLVAHKSGLVLLSFVVTTEGTVADIRVVRTTDAGFNDASVAAVARWQFFPGMKDGRPVSVRLQAPLNFSPGPAEGK